MANELGKAKQHIKRAQLLCDHIVEHLTPVYDSYSEDHPEFGELVFTGGRFAKELRAYLDKVFDEFVAL